MGRDPRISIHTPVATGADLTIIAVPGLIATTADSNNKWRFAVRRERILKDTRVARVDVQNADAMSISDLDSERFDWRILCGRRGAAVQTYF
jgi:hypothetical protein